MDYFAMMKESYWVFLVAAILFFILTVGLFVSMRKFRRRFKKQKKESDVLRDKCERLALEIETLHGEIETIRAIAATGEIPPVLPGEAWDSEPDDAPLFLDEVLDPQIFEMTVDGSMVEVRVPSRGGDSVTEYDTGKNVARYTVKFDAQKNDWVIRKFGQIRAVRRFPTKDEAIKAAKELARKSFK